MQKSITLNGISISYSVRHSARARRLQLAIHPGGRLVVTIPKRMPESFAEKYILEMSAWILKKLALFQKLAKDKPDLFSGKDYATYRGKARVFAAKRLEAMNVHYNFTYYRISVRDQKTRWGSCSRGGNLSFNFKILFLPPELADYIIVHELCHLKEFNHSKRFWALVAQTVPDYKKHIAELNKLGLFLD